MDLFATFYVLVVATVHTAFPSAGIPQVLGIETENRLAQNRAVSNDVESSVRDRVREARDQVIERRTIVRNDLQTRRENVQVLVEDKQAEFRERISQIKDDRKKELLEKINDRLTTVGSKWVDAWNRRLGRLSELLAKMQVRAERLEETGADIANVNAAIREASVLIDATQAAINDFADNVYVIEITDDNTIGGEVRSLVDQFKSDLGLVTEKFREVHSALQDVLTALRNAAGESQNE